VRVGRQRYYILGRDSSVAHVLLTHPSVSKQHAVVQFRTARWTRGEGLPGAEEPSADFGGDRDLVEEGAVVPWLIDLSSRNGTYLNRVRIAPETFVRIRTGDTVVFGASTDECVFAQETQIEEEEEEEQ
jgi:smad nuclear-interacting protein 1